MQIKKLKSSNAVCVQTFYETQTTLFKTKTMDLLLFTSDAYF